MTAANIAHPEWGMAASAFELPEDKRDNRRQRLLLTLKMVDAQGAIHEVHLLNISHNGAKLDTDIPPSPNDRIILIEGENRVPGRVAWVEGNRFGVAFDQPIDAHHIIRRGQQHLAG
jgi:hypothetical protein